MLIFIVIGIAPVLAKISGRRTRNRVLLWSPRNKCKLKCFNFHAPWVEKNRAVKKQVIYLTIKKNTNIPWFSTNLSLLFCHLWQFQSFWRLRKHSKKWDEIANIWSFLLPENKEEIRHFGQNIYPWLVKYLAALLP